MTNEEQNKIEQPANGAAPARRRVPAASAGQGAARPADQGAARPMNQTARPVGQGSRPMNQAARSVNQSAGARAAANVVRPAGGQTRPVGGQQPRSTGSAGGRSAAGQNARPAAGAMRVAPSQAALGSAKPSSAVSRDRRRVQQQLPHHTDLMPALDMTPVNKSVYNGGAGTQQRARANMNGNGQDRPAAAPMPAAFASGAGSASSATAAAIAAPQNGDRRANYTARETKLRIIPLGGLGEIGKNMTVLEYGNDMITMDMGFKFPTSDQPGVDYIIPDTSWLVKNRHKVRGHIITHGHEDHIGGIPFILPKFPAPMFGARFTLGRIEAKLQEYRLQTQPEFRVIDPDKHERIQLGAFNIELVRVTHSIPDACAIVVRTPAGTIINTGDWRLDPKPVDGKNMDMKRLGEIGDEGVDVLMSDSTSCEREGRTPSEFEIADTFDDLFNRAQGRVIISTFSTQINRMQLIIDAAHRNGRRLSLVGRSMLSNVELAVKQGILKVPAGMIMRVQDIVNQPDRQAIIMCTGSQGEENSALSRMATGDHPNIKIKTGDTIIFSSNPIPGNEISVVRSVDNLMREGARIYQQATREIDDMGLIHVSGHASRDDILDLVSVVRPKYFMPIHGEFHHLVRNAELVVTKGGIPEKNVFVMDNGDVLEVSPSGVVRGGRVPAGMIMIDGAGVGDVEGIVLRDRLAMAGDGVFMIVATISRKTGKLVSSPDIISRGFIYMKENEDLINVVRGEVRKMFEKRRVDQAGDWAKFKLKMRDEISDILYARTKRNPMVLPVINEI